LFGRLFLLMTVVPAVELYLLIQLGSYLGAVTTIWLVIVTGIVGASLAKREGLSVVQKIQSDTLNGVPPTQGLTEGLLVLLGGVLLITPGVITDAVGLMAIFPLTRRLIAPVLSRKLEARVQVMDGVNIGTPTAGPAARRVRDQFNHPVSAEPLPRRIEEQFDHPVE
jgi:UPF0716 protein FxsA